ncbi:hypothetical protein [Streptomyces sp. 7N604]|uniref:hypothetical protein n=1 Tax=Streptomyces sp. 7N604 TaxID=3457415 RepID=UPI003FD223B9
MSASREKQRARLRTLFTGESHQQALSATRSLTAGDPVVPEASTDDQQLIEAAVLSELDDACAPWNWWEQDEERKNSVFYITRVTPSPDALRLHLAEDSWRSILDALLPAFDSDDEDWPVLGVPGLRCRPLPQGAELYHLDATGRIELAVPPNDRADLHAWITSGEAAGQTRGRRPAVERAFWPRYVGRLEAVPGKSRVLRHLLAFSTYPQVTLTGTGQSPEPVPSEEDFEQIARVLLRRRTASPAAQPEAPRVPGAAALGGLHRVAAVVGPRAAGGVGRSLFTANLAVALANEGNVSVLVVNADGATSGVSRFLAHALSGEPASQGQQLLRNGARLELARCPDGVQLADSIKDVLRDSDHDVVLLDTGPMDQVRVAQLAEVWIGVTPLWAQPGRLTEMVSHGRDGRRLSRGWEKSWLAAMRSNGWDVTTRTAVRDPESLFADYDSAHAAGLVIIGDRGESARSRQELAASSGLPVLHPGIPDLVCDAEQADQVLAEPTGRTAAVHRAYRAVARQLLAPEARS